MVFCCQVLQEIELVCTIDLYNAQQRNKIKQFIPFFIGLHPIGSQILGPIVTKNSIILCPAI